jgi:hypothetical protein
VTPTLFDLPLRLGDTAALAEVLLDVLGALPKPVTDEQRARIASRAGSVRFQNLRVYFGSLERDPVHSAAYYVCVDGIDDQPMLLRVAPSTTPSSGLFPRAILIGRTHLGPREVVINAVPFGPDDRGKIQVFSEQLNKAFLPKPAGMKAVVAVQGDSSTFAGAFETFRKTLKSTGQNQAAFALAEGQDAEEFYFAVVWSAIRIGWREGYALQGVRRPVGRTSDRPAT